MTRAAADSDPNWPTASAWLAGEYAATARQTLGILGAPLCRGSITPGRCDLAPDAIRGACVRFSTYDIENNLDLRRLAVRDLGNLAVAGSTVEEAFEPITRAVSS